MKKITIRKTEKAQYGCMTLAFMYAYFPRSILARYLFGGILLYLFYFILVSLIAVVFVKQFLNTREQVGWGFYLPWGVLLFAVVAIGCAKSNSWDTLMRFSIVLLLPLVLPRSLVTNKKWHNAFIFMALLVTLGCFINFAMPSFYRHYIVPMFLGNDYTSVLWVLSLNAYPGFVSQTGYASFFICVGIGSAYCFKKAMRRNTKYLVYLLLLAGGLLLTGKRGPAIMCVLTCAIQYYLEGKGTKKFERILYLVLAAFLLYGVLSLLVTIGVNIPGIEKIYSVISGMIQSGKVDDTGRAQLYLQAINYFTAHPLMGIGWCNYMNLFTLRGTHVHNIYLQLLCETGIVGFVIFVAFFAVNLIRTYIALKCYQVKSEYSYAWVKFSLFIQIYFLLYGITGNPLYDNENVMFYFLAVGISNMAYRLCKGKKNHENRNTNLPIRS